MTEAFARAAGCAPAAGRLASRRRQRAIALACDLIEIAPSSLLGLEVVRDLLAGSHGQERAIEVRRDPVVRLPQPRDPGGIGLAGVVRAEVVIPSPAARGRAGLIELERGGVAVRDGLALCFRVAKRRHWD